MNINIPTPDHDSLERGSKSLGWINTKIHPDVHTRLKAYCAGKVNQGAVIEAALVMYMDKRPDPLRG